MRTRRVPFIVLLIAAMGMGVWFYSEYALLAIAGLYVSHGLIWWIIRVSIAKLRPTTP